MEFCEGDSMKYQFINSAGKVHEYNFLKTVLPNQSVDIYSDTGYFKYANEEVANYYKSNDISVKCAKSFDKIKIPFIKHFLNLLSGIFMILKSNKKKYDYCFIHFLSTRRAILSLFVRSKTKVILVAYGSDILRRKKLDDFFFKSMIKRCYKIVFNSKNMKSKFSDTYGDKFDDKVCDISFPSFSFNRLEKLLNSSNMIDCKKFFGLPLDKKIIVCGHSSTHEEQFEKMIPQFLKMNKKLLDSCHFVFFMTYGAGDYLEYRDKIKSILAQTTLSYTVLDEFLNYEEMSWLHLISDYHITGITTDALSYFMLEEMYAGSIVIYGKWLNYLEFDDGFNAIPYSDFDSLSIVFSDALINYRPKELLTVKKSIAKLTDNNLIKKEWDYIL